MRALAALLLATTTCAPAQVVFVRSIDLCAMDCRPPRAVTAVMEIRQADGSVARLCRCSEPPVEQPPPEQKPDASNWDSYDPPPELQLPAPHRRARVRLASTCDTAP